MSNWDSQYKPIHVPEDAPLIFPPSWTFDPPGRVAYGVLDESVTSSPDALVFMPEERAKELDRLRGGLYAAKTWGELRSMISEARWKEILSLCGLDDEPPADDDPFDADRVPGYGDGDWPEWPAQQMLEWMPREIRERFGTVVFSVFNGPFLSIDAENETAIVQALEQAGYECVRADRVVAGACGY